MIAETTFAVEDFRKHIRAMSDEKLERTGKAARYMCDPRNSADKRTVRCVYIVQFRECRAEWQWQKLEKLYSATSISGPKKTLLHTVPRNVEKKSRLAS